APPGVALLVADAVELARKVEGYHCSAGKAVSLMASETISGLSPWPEVPDVLEPPVQNRRSSEVEWEHSQECENCWGDLSWDAQKLPVGSAPADDADPHERLIFWTMLQGRLDAVRGRLLRLVDDRGHAGHGLRERMGLSLREARGMIRLDRALLRLPVTYRAYAAGRLGNRAAWLVSRVATASTDHAWARYALTHTLRMLEVVVETARLKREVDPDAWERDGGLPPPEAPFGEAVRACSLLEVNGRHTRAARIEFVLDSEQDLAYRQAGAGLRGLYGGERPEWWCLAVMARHFIDTYGGSDASKGIYRRVIERDNYTCTAPECLQRGGLEADHIRLRSHQGPTTLENMTTLCAADHRYMKHQAGTLVLIGEAPRGITVRMGERVYRNDRLIRSDKLRAPEVVQMDDPFDALVLAYNDQGGDVTGLHQM
ncbi:MAG TPA: HNH endonuclease signature motif containing protein, partial [Candidatus Polarisedimenticolia bacterium]|nr:HNH endonuclease signature motif containing protein [Candidatus Polarisedimenticolia bacterium]